MLVPARRLDRRVERPRERRPRILGVVALMKRTSSVHAIRAASSSDASIVISTGSPSRGKTHAS